MSRHMTLDDRQIIHAGLKRAESLAISAAVSASGLPMRRQRYARAVDTKRIFRTAMPYGLQGSPRIKKLSWQKCSMSKREKLRVQSFFMKCGPCSSCQALHCSVSLCL